jgi:hypothetical protein
MGVARDKYKLQCPDFFKAVDEPDERKGWFKVTKGVLYDDCHMCVLSSYARCCAPVLLCSCASVALL